MAGGAQIGQGGPSGAVGGRVLWHPDGFQEFTVRVAAAPDRDGGITDGIADYDVETEHYWVLTDSLNTVVATSVLTPGPADPWGGPVEFPVVWTRRWGRGGLRLHPRAPRRGSPGAADGGTRVTPGVFADRAAPLRSTAAATRPS
ncbi:hypothetical protein [Streptomyces sp. NPDC096323]|uniref:hypothetical protein n=1 Tax=Streptomyces sp. NPDC096323 TaxID=3155822 RepID=UPI003322542D